MTMKSYAKRHPARAGLIVVVALAFLLAALPQAPLAIVTVSGTGTTHGQTVTVNVAGDEAPWGAVVSFKGVSSGSTEKPFTAEAWSSATQVSASSQDPAHGETKSFRAYRAKTVTPALTEADGAFSSARFEVTVAAIEHPRNFRLLVCTENTVACGTTLGQTDLVYEQPGVPVTLSVSLATGSGFTPGQTVYMQVRCFYNNNGYGCDRSAGQGALVTTGSTHTLNPKLGTAAYSGVLTHGQASPSVPVTLALGSNSLTAAAEGSGRFDYTLTYDTGKAPIVTGITVNPGGSATASWDDENVPSGDSVIAYEWTLKKDGALAKKETTTGSTFTFTPSPASWTLDLRVQDERGVWSASAQKAFTIAADNTVEVPADTLPDAGDSPVPVDDEIDTGGSVGGGGSAKSPAGSASANPADYLRRSAKGLISVLNAVTGVGFTNAPPSWLPEFLFEWIYEVSN